MRTEIQAMAAEPPLHARICHGPGRSALFFVAAVVTVVNAIAARAQIPIRDEAAGQSPDFYVF